jgi:pyruvate dehydrogenase (quinone)
MMRWNELMEIRGTRSDLPLKPQVVARALNEYLDRDAIICSDTGTITTWAARHILIREDMEFSVSGTLATMANGLAYSIGAAVAFPGRQVVCFTGDGGLTMLMGELATIAKYRLPVKVIVIKNNVLGMIKWEQLAFEGNPQYGVQLQPIDFVAVARACGIAGFSVEDPALVRAVLGDAFHHAGPALVEASVAPNAPPLPVKLRGAGLAVRKALAKGQKIDGTSSKRSSRTRSEKWCKPKEKQRQKKHILTKESAWPTVCQSFVIKHGNRFSRAARSEVLMSRGHGFGLYYHDFGI